MIGRVALAAALLLPLAAAARPTAAAQPCALDLEQRNSWSRVASTGVVGMDDSDPCRLLEIADGKVLTSDDGGLTRQVVGPAPAAPARLVTAHLAEQHALLVSPDGTVRLTGDRGRTWVAATGLDGPVTRLVTDESDPQRVFALVAGSGPALPVVGTRGTLAVSRDGGRSFHAVTGATGLEVTAVVADAGVPSRWWIGVGGPAAGLYVSEDAGGTFTKVDPSGTLARPSGSDVRDLATSRLAGGGSEVVAATADGLLVTRDAGQTVVQHQAGKAFTALSLEWRHPSAALLLSGGVLRTSDVGVHTRSFAAGLPRGCAAEDLRRDRSVPSVFLVACGDGSTWRLRSDGTDLSKADVLDDGIGTNPPPPGGVTRVPTPMQELRRLRLPVPGSRADGALAFDGAVLYYTDQAVPGVVHRLLARTGAALPDVAVDLPHAAFQIAYDANRDHLVVVDVEQVLWDVELRTGNAARLFRTSGFTGPMTFDSASGHILMAADGANAFTEYDLAGRRVGGCPGTFDAGLAENVSMAGMVATGDGLIYAENEDDTTVSRLDRSCHVLATFAHEAFSEAPAENDALACDTTTFATPAVWLRDAEAAVVVAYSVESGYCALPSTVSVIAPPGVALGRAGTVCATLRSKVRQASLAGLPVDLLVAGRGIGSPVTDRSGRACAAYRPLSREAGAGTGTSTARQPVVAAFLGTPAYRPSTARASVVVSRAVTLPPLAHPPPAIGQPAPAPAVVVPVPPPPVQPPPPPPNVPQQNPVQQPQGHPGAQPGAMGAPGSAPMPEEEGQAAVETGEVHRMVGLDGGAVLPFTAAVVLGGVVTRRRRASRVRPQW